MQVLIQFLEDNPLFLLFLVAGIGYPLGRIKIGGVRLGVAFVLFVGFCCLCVLFFFFQAEDGIRDLVRSRGLGDVYKRQAVGAERDRPASGHWRQRPGARDGHPPDHGQQPGARTHAGRLGGGREERPLSLIHI